MGFGEESWLLQRVLFLIPVILSLSVHEWAHAWSAWLLGDDTAARQGRLTLNPLAHMDPVGTLLLPLIAFFGWAKPVPVEPLRFRRGVNMRWGMVITAAAGPISNVVIAAVALGVWALCVRFQPELAAQGGAVHTLLHMLVLLNVILALFNLVPIPPLDGSRIVDGLVPESLRPAWETFSSVGFIGIIAVIVVPLFMGVNIFAWPMALVDALFEV